jgi:NADP-dependent 3-hydroxy acid dehydrogenase YdfG
MESIFKDKVVVITDKFYDIGKAIALNFIKKGAKLSLWIG